jgi:hypothetical protein
MPLYTYITYADARAALASRLYDLTKVFWVDAELKLLIQESLRTWNALTAFWVGDYAFTVTAASLPWLTLNKAGSPRVYTQKDTDLYALILYHIMETQLAAGVWTGTPQFTVADLTQAFERRQNEILTITSANVQNPVAIVLTPNTRTVTLPDTMLDVRRVRYVPALQPPKPQTLWRGDSASFAYFTPGYRQTPQNPRNYALSDRPPLTMDVDFPPVAAGSLDLLATTSCTPSALPASVAIAIPDDWVWVLKWGMLMDLFNKQGESQDEPRAKYATVRYMEGVSLMQQAPWVLSAEFGNIPTDVESVMERDTFDPGWETNPVATTRPGIITAGIDLVSVCPRPTGATNVGVVLELVVSAPVPVQDSDFVQAPRDVLDVILDYAVHLAAFKQGGAEFEGTIPLFDNFRKAAALYNKRISNLGLYDDVLKRQGHRYGVLDDRYAGGVTSA